MMGNASVSCTAVAYGSKTAAKEKRRNLSFRVRYHDTRICMASRRSYLFSLECKYRHSTWPKVSATTIKCQQQTPLTECLLFPLLHATNVCGPHPSTHPSSTASQDAAVPISLTNSTSTQRGGRNVSSSPTMFSVEEKKK